MAFIRAKRQGDKVYYYLVESRREGKRVRQKVLKYLGTSVPEDTEAVKQSFKANQTGNVKQGGQNDEKS